MDAGRGSLLAEIERETEELTPNRGAQPVELDLDDQRSRS
jgi:hypothetical protein